MVRVRQGVTRTVLLIGPYALKFPLGKSWRMSLYGLLSNMQEATWARRRLPILCPVVWSVPGGWLVVMRRAEPYPRDRPLPEALFEHYPWMDLKHENFGLLNGQVVVVDYGELT